MWKASNIVHVSRPGIPSGFTVLDNHLPGQGWPDNGLTELLLDRWGIGEMRLLAPALAYLSQSQSRMIILVSPPFVPYAPALFSLGIDLTKILVINPEHQKDSLWAVEKSLASECCSAVLAWPEYRNRANKKFSPPSRKNGQRNSRRNSLNDKDIRRLQLACKNGNSWGIIFRPAYTAKQFSPAELRIQLEASRLSSNHLSTSRLSTSRLSTNWDLHLHILKRRGGWATDIHLDFHDYLSEIEELGIAGRTGRGRTGHPEPALDYYFQPYQSTHVPKRQ